MVETDGGIHGYPVSVWSHIHNHNIHTDNWPDWHLSKFVCATPIDIPRDLTNLES